MILNNFVKLKINPRNVIRLKGLGYVGNIGNDIDVKIEHLTRWCRSKIDVKCDICGSEKTINYCDYIGGIENSGFYCCIKCKNIKSKKTNLEKYGNEKYNNLEKNKQTCLEKYGCKNVFQNEGIKGKIKDSLLKKYGVDSFTKTDEYIIKTKKTKKDKYNDENFVNVNKIKKTCLDKYGVDSYMKTEEFRKASKKYTAKHKKEMISNSILTNIKKYGCENVFQNEEIKDKIKQTNLERYGVEHPAQNENIHTKQQKTAFKIHQYKDTELFYRGSYEKDFLDKYYDKIKIEKAISERYNYKNVKRVYFPDFYLPDFNLVIEIKL